MSQIEGTILKVPAAPVGSVVPPSSPHSDQTGWGFFLFHDRQIIQPGLRCFLDTWGDVRY